MPLRRTAVAVLAALAMLPAAAALADAPLIQGFEDGAPAWTATGMWHVQSEPQNVTVIPAIADDLVTLADDGHLPSAIEGSNVAWFGQAATGTYCGADFATIKQTPQDGCTSTQRQSGALTSPSFSLADRGTAYLVFRGWWEIESVQADVADQMRIDYSTDGGATWVPAGSLNPLDPSWGGKHQPFTDAGPRTSASWVSYSADLSGAAGASDVRVRFVFDSVDTLRNGFRGLLIDGVSVVDPLGATITEPGAGPFTDAPPKLSVKDPHLTQTTDGGWHVGFTVVSSHTTTHDVGADWTVTGKSGNPVATGHVTIPAGATEAPVITPVSGADGPYTTTLSNPTGGSIDPSGGTGSTPGGSVPVITITSVGATPTGDGLVAVAVEVGLDAPAADPVSVDYTVTGSDGVVAATGTLTVPVGGVTASTTELLPSVHAPYTVDLSNPRGALLDSSSTSATTSPLAGIATVTPPDSGAGGGEQLVLGVRQSAGGPTLNQTFDLSVLSGTVLYHRPGEPYTQLRSGSVQLPLGSVVDATNGHAVITVAIDKDGTLQQVEVWDGKVGVFQVGNPVVTELRLAGGDYSTCVGASRKHATKRGRAVRGAKSPVVRQLWASGKGKFRTKGRFGSATVRGTKWLTQDLCLATRFTVAEGVVDVLDFRRAKHRTVRAGQTVTIGALQSARFRNRRGIHGPKLSNVRPG